jgi:hypothetical protein
MMEHFPRLRRLKTDAEILRVAEIARGEEHICFDPSHGIWKDGHLVGHFSICAAPFVMGHIPRGTRPRESVNLISVAEDIAASQFNHVFFPVAKTSPFHPLMGRLGFDQVAEMDLFYKELKPQCQVS